MTAKLAAYRRYLSRIGRKGGKSRSTAKQQAARANGKLGGRPKLTP